MIGAILCGGNAKRLQHEINDIPKSLIEIKKGYTILDKQLNELRNAGINNVILLTGHLSDKIEERYGTSWNNIKISYSKEHTPNGTLCAICTGLKNIKDDIIIRNGDCVMDVNINNMISNFKNSEYKSIMLVAKMRSPYGIVKLGDNHIIEFVEKPILDYYFNAGIYCFKKGLVDTFENIDKGDIEKIIFPDLAKSKQIEYIKNDNLFWISVDTIKDIETLHKEYINRTDKPWGYEKILVNTDKYLTKELFIFNGYQTSFHYHKYKDETMVILKGSGYIEFEKGKEYFTTNDSIRIKPNTTHTIVATENVQIMEISTPHIHDTTRVKDFYDRRDVLLK